MRIFVLLLLIAVVAVAQGQPVKYVRYELNGQVSYGILENDTIYQLKGDLFSGPEKTGTTVSLNEVKLLVPCEPSKVVAVGRNYKSHLGDTPPAEYPGLFAKYPTCLIATGENIIYPNDATLVHAEAEMVVVIGKTAKDVSEAEAPQYIFGVTAGNDVSERNWQKADLQWLRAKGSDTFGPIGPAIVAGLNYQDLLVEGKINGKVVQSQRTKDMIFSVKKIVSYISQYVTLYPGDVIFTGTPGKTSEIKPGDLIEITVEGVGTLKNRIVKE